MQIMSIVFGVLRTGSQWQHGKQNITDISLHEMPSDSPEETTRPAQVT